MKVVFKKYSGLGNDFVLIEVESQLLKFSPTRWSNIAKKICERRLGIGADGIILFWFLDSGFEMTTINADGSYASMCGNATRCALRHYLTINNSLKETPFVYKQFINKEFIYLKCNGLKVNNTFQVTFFILKNARGPYNISSLPWYYINSGTDHAVTFLKSKRALISIDLQKIGKEVRFSKYFKPKGTNVDFVYSAPGDKFYLRTYERGVEDETLSCGTGSIASVLAYMFNTKQKNIKADVIQRSGKILHIECELLKDKKLRLQQTGNVTELFVGIYDID